MGVIKVAFQSRQSNTEPNHKQHLNLSPLAYAVLQNDMFAFGQDKQSGFINTVLENYCPTANASISRTLRRIEGELFQLLTDIPDDNDVKNQIISELLKQNEKCLLDNISYEGGRAFKFWLNKNNLEYLTRNNSECEEEKFYASRGKYIKSILEEYARLPFVERERIYFLPLFEKINQAIENQYQLRMVTEADFTVYSVYPYQILSDPLSTTSYLVGYSVPYGDSGRKKRPCSFKISALKSVTVEKSKSAFLKKSEKDTLKQTISSLGVPFMIGEMAEILIHFTPDGLHKYHRLTHLRPAFTEKRENDIYVFKCSLAQAEFYFFKFGADAEIISPPELRNRFRAMYDAALHIYD